MVLDVDKACLLDPLSEMLARGANAAHDLAGLDEQVVQLFEGVVFGQCAVGAVHIQIPVFEFDPTAGFGVPVGGL